MDLIKLLVFPNRSIGFSFSLCRLQIIAPSCWHYTVIYINFDLTLNHLKFVDSVESTIPIHGRIQDIGISICSIHEWKEGKKSFTILSEKMNLPQNFCFSLREKMYFHARDLTLTQDRKRQISGMLFACFSAISHQNQENRLLNPHSRLVDFACFWRGWGGGGGGGGFWWQKSFTTTNNLSSFLFH